SPSTNLGVVREEEPPSERKMKEEVMKVERKKWIAVGTLAALGLGAGSAVAVPALNAGDRPDTAVVESTQPTSSQDGPTANESADSPASPDSANSPNSPASANSP